MWRISAALVAVWLIGTIGVRQAQRAHLLVVNTGLSMTGVAEGPSFTRLDAQQASAAPLCGRHDILAQFYAIDMMLPIVQLHQEDKCELTHTAETKWWRIGAAVFSILGKLITSLALLTYTGVLKPREE
jgi:hypothetical protein